MRRWTVRVVCWLALGAVVNVAVAWAISIYSDSGGMGLYGIRSTVPLPWPAPEYVPANIGQTPRIYIQSKVWGRTETVAFEPSQPPDAIEQVLQGWSMQASSSGWPLRTVREIRFDSGDSNGGTVPVCFRESMPLPRGLLGVNSDHRLPLGLLWPGLLLNAIFYALPLALLWLAPSTIRRWHRRRHHLCMHCSYPVADPAKPCSECGKSPTAR